MYMCLQQLVYEPVEVSGQKESHILTQSLSGTEDETGVRENLSHQIHQLVWV